MVKVGERDGMPLYSPENKDDEKLCKGRTVLVCKVSGIKATITALQMRSVHLYLSMLSSALNAAGWDMKATMEVLSKKGTIPWSPSAIKERLFRPVIKDTFNKESTTELETAEVGIAYEALNQITSERLGVGVAFPDHYSQMTEQLNRK